MKSPKLGGFSGASTRRFPPSCVRQDRGQKLQLNLLTEKYWRHPCITFNIFTLFKNLTQFDRMSLQDRHSFTATFEAKF
jgi:hypothetical protein